MPMLELQDVTVAYPRRNALPLLVVKGISLEIGRGECVGLVGESGCGKTSLANAVTGLLSASGGRIRFRGTDTASLEGEALRAYRRGIQMVFQDPLDSLNPRMTVGAAIQEVLKVHKLAHGRRERNAEVNRLLADVGLSGEHAARYPHELSGGQRQRVGIARALAVKPSLIIADEPVSALDVSVQAQILEMMDRLRREHRLAFLLIAHDLAVVRQMCSRVLVMYLGQIVECGPAADVFRQPAHPYTEALVSAVPDVQRGLRAREEGSERIVLSGDVPSADAEIAGCPFHTRCHRAVGLCKEEAPQAMRVAQDRFSCCHFAHALMG